MEKALSTGRQFHLNRSKMDFDKVLISFCHIDALIALILFIVENLVENRNFRIHCLILIISSGSVLLSLMEVYVIHKKYFWKLLGNSMIRLGPMVAASIYWIVSSNGYVNTIFISVLVNLISQLACQSIFACLRLYFTGCFYNARKMLERNCIGIKIRRMLSREVFDKKCHPI